MTDPICKPVACERLIYRGEELVILDETVTFDSPVNVAEDTFALTPEAIWYLGRQSDYALRGTR